MKHFAPVTLFLGSVVVAGFACRANPDDGKAPSTVASAVTPAPPPASPPASPPPTAASAARRSLGRETNAKMGLAATCADCPSFTVTVDRSGALVFDGERRVRMAHATAQLTNEETKSLFEHVVPGVFVDRPSPEPPGKIAVELRFEDETGRSVLAGDTPCTPPTGRYDRHTAPSPRCELEHALRDAVRPFTYCGPKGCPDKPDPTATPADFGDLTLGCKPACRRVLLDGKPLGKTPTTLRLALGLHEIELHRFGQTPQRTSVRVEAGQHTRLIVDMSRPSMKVELERAMGELAAEMLGQR